MSKTFISYVWNFSARQQIYVLILTVLSFPLLYMTLELPKQIINDAIQGDGFPISLLGFSFEQVPYLVFLSFAYLGFVLVGGLLKMHTNTVKGVIGERLLRRLRYQLIERIMRFPLPYFRRTSQGALISMVIAEAEAIGGMLGEAIARPAFAIGQMLTILAFFFIQNFWLGLAAIVRMVHPGFFVRPAHSNADPTRPESLEARLDRMRSRLGDERFERLQEANRLDLALYEIAIARFELREPTDA